MPRKSFLSRVDSQKAISSSTKSKDADDFIKSLNHACQVIIERMIKFVPGMHGYKSGKGGRSKRRKHKGIVGKFVWADQEFILLLKSRAKW